MKNLKNLVLFIHKPKYLKFLTWYIYINIIISIILEILIITKEWLSQVLKIFGTKVNDKHDDYFDWVYKRSKNLTTFLFSGNLENICQARYVILMNAVSFNHPFAFKTGVAILTHCHFLHSRRNEFLYNFTSFFYFLVFIWV